jgi:hypothetical protein
MYRVTILRYNVATVGQSCWDFVHGKATLGTKHYSKRVN